MPCAFLRAAGGGRALLRALCGLPMEVDVLLEAGAAPARPIRVLCALRRRAHSLRALCAPAGGGCALWRWAPCGGGRPMETDILWRLCVPSARCGGGGALFALSARPSGSGCALWRRVSYGDRLPMEVWTPYGGGCGACASYTRLLRAAEAGAPSACSMRAPLVVGCALWRRASYGGGRPVEAGAPPAHLIRVLCAPQRRTRPLGVLCARPLAAGLEAGALGVPALSEDHAAGGAAHCASGGASFQTKLQ